MKTSYINFHMLVVLITAATLTACSSDNSIIDEQQPTYPNGTYTMTVSASKGGDASTRALSLSGSALNATWATTENVYVKKGETWASGSLQPQDNAATATLKGTLSGISIAENDNLTLQFPKSGDITYAGQVGTLADIAANFDYAKATVEVESVSATGNINPKAATTTFTSQQAIVKFMLKDKGNSDAAISATQLVVSDGTNSYTVTPASATSEIYVAIPGFSGQTVTLTATVGSDTYSYEKSGVTFANGQYYAITVKMTKQPPVGALSGRFSVSSTKQVYFSQGNLQATYNGYSWTWAFAANQWDYIGNEEGNTKVTDSTPFVSDYSGSSTTVDLFGWVGASSTWTGAAQYGITSSDATNKTDGYGNVAKESLKSDWGTLIGDGSTWRTLTTAEWTYLFNTRKVNGNTGSGYTYTLGQSVNGKLGIVIYPDNYTGSTYAGSDWSSFESAGCVFLPRAGYRIKAKVTLDLETPEGCYWSSSSPYGDFGANYAYRVYFTSVYLSTAGTNDRNRGYSVRLVRDAE